MLAWATAVGLGACAAPTTGVTSGRLASLVVPRGDQHAKTAGNRRRRSPAGAVETFLRTDPEMVKRFGATPHDGRLACAITPIVPPSNDHLALPRPDDDERVRDGVRSRG